MVSLGNYPKAAIYIYIYTYLIEPDNSDKSHDLLKDDFQ